jgi:hypothetical protein
VSGVRNVESALKRLYEILEIAQEEGYFEIGELAKIAIRELEDTRGEALDLETWLANHRGLFEDVGYYVEDD